ncbi:MAG: MarR family transcriptional regulator [Solirubrobacteraceae bacterium]
MDVDAHYGGRCPPALARNRRPPLRLRLHKHDLRAMLAFVQATTSDSVVPSGSAPAGSTPAGSAPAGSAPAGSAPAGSAPAGSAPAGSTPAGSTPAGSTPAGSTPAGSTPAQTGATAGAPAEPGELAADLYGLVVFLHKNCNADLFEAIGLLELSITQIKLLHQLEEANHELTLKEASELLPLSLPAVSRTVDDLVRRGMISRHEDVEDRRMKRISLTDTGRSVIRRVNGARLIGLQQFTRSLDGEEREALSGALAHLLRRPDVAACRPEGLQIP